MDDVISAQLNYFATAGLNDIVFTIFLPSNPGRLHGAMHLRKRGHDFVLPNIILF